MTETITQLTPMMQQYMDCKQRYKDAVLFFRLGDFYEMFFEDAQVVSRELGLTLTSRSKDDDVPMAGVPHHAHQTYVAQLIAKGYTVAIAEQLETPAEAKGMIKRDVVRVITPGVVLDSENLEAREPNYVAAIEGLGEGFGAEYGVAYLDVSTGEFRATEVASLNDLLSELHRVGAREVLAPDYIVEALSPHREQLPHMYLRPKHPDYFNVEGLLRQVSKGPRIQLAAEAESYFLDADALSRTLRPVQAFGFGTPELVESACAAVLRYVVKTQRGVPSHVRAVSPYRAQAFLVLDEATRANLELTETLMGGKKKGSLLSVLDQTVTAIGARRLRQWLTYPLIDVREIDARLDAVEELVKHPAVRDDVRKLLGEVYDLERLCGRVSSGSANARDMRSLLATLEVIPQVKDALSESRSDALIALEQALDPCEELCALIDRAIVEAPPTSTAEGGLFKLGYHDELDEILNLSANGKDWMLNYEAQERRDTGINSLKVKYNKVFGYYLEVTRANFDMVPERYIRKQTLANAERYYTAELKEMEDRVLHAEERRNTLEQQLFEQLRQTVAGELERLMRTASELATLDVFASMAELALKRDYTRPIVHAQGQLEIEEGRHPVVEVSLAAGERFVPNGVELGPERRLGVITGPNMAGKSTVIRQVALISLMAQMGSFVPARAANLGVVDKIFSRVGASDNLARGQSTFMVEMTETAHILNNATARSLIILDEIGRGTATYDGLSIAWAVAEHLHHIVKAKTLFATHYHEMTDLADRLDGAFNMSIAVKEWQDNIIFLRKLVDGPANRSYGIQVGRLAGLPDAVVTRAKAVLAILEAGHFEELQAEHRSTPRRISAGAPDEDAPQGAPPQVEATAAPTPPAPPAAPAASVNPPTPAPLVAPPAASAAVTLAPTTKPVTPAPQPQLSLFGGAGVLTEAQAAVMEELRRVAIGHVTPIEALVLLDRLSRTLQNDAR